MPYFDASDNAHKALLPTDLRGRSDLADLAAVAEADVLDAFTRYDEAAEADVVDLRGYDSDPEGAEASLASTLRRTIANVIRWRAALWDREPAASMEVRGSRTKSYKGSSDSDFPPNWRRPLRRFETGRSPLFRI